MNKPQPNNNRKPMMAMGLERGPAGWSVVEMQIQDGKVISRKVSEPDLRAFALERLTTEFSKFWDEE